METVKSYLILALSSRSRFRVPSHCFATFSSTTATVAAESPVSEPREHDGRRADGESSGKQLAHIRQVRAEETIQRPLRRCTTDRPLDELSDYWDSADRAVGRGSGGRRRRITKRSSQLTKSSQSEVSVDRLDKAYELVDLRSGKAATPGQGVQHPESRSR